MRDIRLFLSDIQLSSTRDQQPAAPYWWLDQAGIQRVAGFFDYLAANAMQMGIKEIILLGDVFDTWVIPHDKCPPDISAILPSLAGSSSPLTRRSTLLLPGFRSSTVLVADRLE